MGFKVMKLLRSFGTVCALALVSILGATFLSAPVNAFQETQIAPDAAATGDAPEKAQANIGNADAVELTTPSEDANSSDGIEINIPGIGIIGKLPKLDFGLELLYGADEKPETATATPDEDNSDSEVLIRGTVKHRF